MSGELYVVATPIGNLEDISARALRILNEVDTILCEDTRVTRKLLSHYDIHTPTERFDAAVEGEKIASVLEQLSEGKSFALVSDAGTPTVSDPGARLVHAAHEAGLTVNSVPGPSAVTAALSISGVSADSFVFLGYPPHKKGRQTFFDSLIREDRKVVIFESTHRILKTLEALGEREVVVVSELTKMYEEVLRGTASDVHKIFEEHPEKQKGEFVIICQ